MEAWFQTNGRQPRYHRLSTALYTNTMFASVPSRRGNNCAQIFVNNLEGCRVYPLKMKGDAHTSLDLLFLEEGMPNTIISDDAPELHAGEFRRKCRQVGSYCKETEPYSPLMNCAEETIRELKRATRRAMLKTQMPKRLWDYCLELQAKIWSNTAHNITTLGGQTPETLMEGETADISELCEYDWCQWLYYRDTQSSFLDATKVLVRYIGPAKSVGPMMCCHIPKANGNILQRSMVGPLTPAELTSADTKQEMVDFITAIHNGPLGPSATDGNFIDDPDSTTPSFDTYGDELGDEPGMPEADSFTVNAYNKYIGAQLRLPLKDTLLEAKVLGRARDGEGNPIGISHANPLWDTRVYDVGFPDGSTAEYGANLIATAMFAQVDNEG
jgi:hypothetical protein